MNLDAERRQKIIDVLVCILGARKQVGSRMNQNNLLSLAAVRLV